MERLSAVWLIAAFMVAGCATTPDSGWITLIDGTKGLDNFERVGRSNWSAVDGAIQADKIPPKEYGYLVTKNTYKDFQIRVEFWASHDANSGIFMRCQNPKDIHDKNCYEANIFDQRKDPTYGTGAITHLAKVIPPMPKVGGKWNVFEITVKGSSITAVLNGVKTSELHHEQFISGPIALQHGQGVIKFRRVQIKPL